MHHFYTFNKKKSVQKSIYTKLPPKNLRLTAFTAGGNSEADIATPTREAVYSLSTAKATAAPLGMATKTPIQRDLSSHLKI